MYTKPVRVAGFTLIELLVVIAIIGILSSIGLLQLANARESARDAKRKADLNSVRSALALYYDTYETFPHQVGFLAFDSTSTTGNILVDSLKGASKFTGSLPQPPLNAEFYYYQSCAAATGEADRDYTLYAVLERPKQLGWKWIISQSRGTTEERPTPGCPQT